MKFFFEILVIFFFWIHSFQNQRSLTCDLCKNLLKVIYFLKFGFFTFLHTSFSVISGNGEFMFFHFPFLHFQNFSEMSKYSFCYVWRCKVFRSEFLFSSQKETRKKIIKQLHRNFSSVIKTKNSSKFQTIFWVQFFREMLKFNFFLFHLIFFFSFTETHLPTYDQYFNPNPNRKNNWLVHL